MRYAVISDIHGNLPALEAVLRDAHTQHIDRYLFLGDYYLCSPYPNEVVQIIKSIDNASVICGNEETYLEKLSVQNQALWTDGQFGALYWSYRTLTEQNRKYLSGLPRTMVLRDEGIQLNLAHSSNDFIGDAEYTGFSSPILSSKYKGIALRSDQLIAEINQTLEGNDLFLHSLSTLADGIYLFGHSHVQWHAAFGRKIFVNPGSCGLALDGMLGAPYTILEVEDTHWYIEERRADYDIRALIRSLKESGLYAQAQVWCDVVIMELESGYEHIHSFLTFVNQYAQRIGDPVRPYSRHTWTEAYEKWHSL